MTRFYQIARLTEGKTIFSEAEKLRIDLDGVMPADLVENDIAFQAAVAPQTWFWLSGGGTLLLNDHYLPIVRRSADARINPGKFSLFTGRADNAAERARPALMVRELFEELLLFEDETLLVPQLEGFQDMVDAAHGAIREAGVLDDGPWRALPLTPVPLTTRPVSIRHQGAERQYQLSWTASPSNDINVLFLFAAECDLARLSARDGEMGAAGKTALRACRDIYLYDPRSRMARPLTPAGEQRIIAREDMTGSLSFLEDLCVGSLRPANSGPSMAHDGRTLGPSP